MFNPVNRLEKLMQAAANDAKKAREFYKVLVDSELFILTPEAAVAPGEGRSPKPNESINVATVEHQGRKWHPAFTSRERIAEYLKAPEACLGAKARDLFGLLPNSNFWLNPKSECQKPLPSDEVALILSGKIFTFDLMRHSRAVNETIG